MAVTLHWSDYFVFALSLLAYALVGLYFRWSTQINNLFNRCLGRPIKEVKPQTAQEIFLANRKLGVLPVMASTIASFLSAATILGNHLEVYLYGLPLMCNLLAQLALHPMVSEIYMPVLYKLQLFSINQYFEMRFGVVAKILATITFIIQTVFYVGASLFAPAVALSAMTGANLLLTILGTGALTTFYTAMGANVGFIVSVVGTFWVSIGGIFRNTIADVPGRPPSTEACPAPGTTTLMPNVTTTAPAPQSQLLDRGFSFYDLSFLWLTAFAMLIGFLVASIVSLASGMNTKKPIRQSLLASQAVSFYNCFPNCHPAQSYDDSGSQGEAEDDTWMSYMEGDKQSDHHDNHSLVMY
nr:unnamed protein product [Spirometra erinaceieuropaei]